MLTCFFDHFLFQSQSKSFLCKCSFIEIYNEQIFDLLDTASASLFVRENIKKGVFVEGALERFVSSAAEAYQVGIWNQMKMNLIIACFACKVILWSVTCRCCLMAGVIAEWPPLP